MKIAAGEGPLERRRRPLVVGLEVQQTLLEFSQRSKVVGSEDFPLNDREIDFDLIKPTGMGRSMKEERIGPFIAQAFGGLLTSMSRTVVHNPKKHGEQIYTALEP